MKSRRFTSVLLLVTLFTSLTSFPMIQAGSPIISVSPITSNVRLGEQFTIEITLDFAENLYGYEVWLSFDPSVLNATAIDYAGYLNEPSMKWYQVVNNTGGYVALAWSNQYPATGKTGGSSPPLATIRFKAIADGTSDLHLYDTHLVDDSAMEITHQTVNGTVHVELAPGHDVAVTNIVSYTTEVYQGSNVSIYVTVQNQGEFTETFNVTAYANTSIIRTQPITLISGDSATIYLEWSTTEVTIGNYTINAYVTPVPNETDTADNSYADGMVRVKMLGDVDDDGDVDSMDLFTLAAAYGTVTGNPLYNAACDFDGDGDVDSMDLFTLAANYGKTC